MSGVRAVLEGAWKRREGRERRTQEQERRGSSRLRCGSGVGDARNHIDEHGEARMVINKTENIRKPRFPKP